MTTQAGQDLDPWTALKYAVALWWRLFRLGLRQWAPVYAVAVCLVALANLLLRVHP